jgi:hypothetical protein
MISVARPVCASLAVLVLTGCAERTPDFVSWRVEQLEHWQDANNYVRLHYPVIVGADAARLNPVIQRWIGAHCSVDPTASFSDAKGCLTGIVKYCSELGAETGCTVDLWAEPWVDAAGCLGIRIEVTSYTGGNHEQTDIEALNLEIPSGRALGLTDLLNRPDARSLAMRITHALRVQRHIPDDKSLTQAGLLTDDIPVSTRVLALPEGLLFIYLAYEIAPYTEGRPQVLVPYADLSDMVLKTGPLPRLHDLLEASGRGS